MGQLHQRASHYAIVGVAVALDVKNGAIQSARVGLTGASSHATRLTNIEQVLTTTNYSRRPGSQANWELLGVGRWE